MSKSRRVVYISYRWVGSKPTADWLAKRLAHDAVLDVDVFQDTHALQPGDDWPSQIQSGLNRASVLVLLIDEDWVRHADQYGRRRIDNPSDWHRLEIERAFARGIPILPVTLDSARVPPAEALPPSLARLQQLQALPLSSARPEEGFGDLRDALQRLLSDSRSLRNNGRDSTLPFQVQRLEVEGFRCFQRFEVDLCRPSKLPGHWTCVAGLNGSGKSSILQALALLLMGPENSRELGGTRLAGMRRRLEDGPISNSHLRARVEHLGQELTLEMTIDSGGGIKWAGENHWSYITQSLILGYGATRNLADAPDRYGELSPPVRACISLFDSLARLEEGERLLRYRDRGQKNDPQGSRAAELFTQIVRALLPEELVPTWSPKGFLFRSPMRQAEAAVTAHELPDGFRSTIAWIADICTRWVSLGKRVPRSTSPEDITGVVLVDEIDLHLHASLQRSLVPRLRRILPNVQFVVTSHSPLILSSFDQQELVLLDRTQPNGVRELDRQILGFSPDQVYEWLMGTPASSEAVDDYLGEADRLRQQGEQLSDVLGVSPDLDSGAARQRADKIKARIQRLSKK
jgi:energy-coupling factor transporter ATP-binding protein EcfA2